MAKVVGYYDNQNFVNCVYAVDIAMTTYLASQFFSGDQSRIVYAKNEYALFQRANPNSPEKTTTSRKMSDLDLPFMNIKLANNQPGLRTWWNAKAFTDGIYIPEINAKVQFRPLTLSYECSFWCKRDSELQFAMNTMGWIADNKTIVQGSVSISKQDIAIPAWMQVTDLNWDPQYAEKDWLDQNNIHTLSAGFDIQTFQLQTDTNISVTETVIFNWAYNHNYTGTNFDEAYKLYLDTVTNEPVLTRTL